MSELTRAANTATAHAMGDLVQAARSVGHAITSPCAPGQDATGCMVASLTESVMGVTAALCRIASAIEEHGRAMDRIATAIERQP